MPKIFENLWVKLAALVLAVLLWFHVATNKVYQIEISLPLSQVILPGKLVLAEPPPDSIRILVSATGKKLLRSDWKRLGLKLSVGNNRPGRFKVPLTTDNLALTMTEKVDLVEIISPTDMELSLDRKMEKNAVIKSKVTVVPSEGYGIQGTDSIKPPVATITGPASLIGGINTLETKQMTINGARNSISVKVPIDNPGIYGLKVEPESVTVNVSVVSVLSKKFSDIPIRLINVPAGRTLSIYPSRLEIRVAATAEIINDLKSGHIAAEADYHDISPNKKIPIKVILPRGVSLITRSADSSTVIKE